MKIELNPKWSLKSNTNFDDSLFRWALRRDSNILIPSRERGYNNGLGDRPFREPILKT